MTNDEFKSLSLTERYKFTFYHGRIAYGFLDEDSSTAKIYLIDRGAMPEYQKRIKPLKDLGEEINIENISSWESIEGQRYSHKNAQVNIHGSVRATKLIIIGAGASYGFINGADENGPAPPLANQLFNNSFSHCLLTYQGAKNMAAEILQAGDIEVFFQGKWDNIVRYHDALSLSKLINVQYYLHDLFLNISKQFSRITNNNYNILVNLAHQHTINSREHVVFVNFNYDTLLEEAMRNSVQYDFKNIDDPVEYQKRKLLLFKPHGSCSMIKRFDRNILKYIPTQFNVNSITILSKLLYEHKIGYDIINANLLDEWRIFDGDEIINATDAAHIDEILYLPQLLIPYKSKDEFVMPHKHDALLDYFLNDIEEILVIGWKGTEDNFQKLLNRKLGNKKIKITAVTNDDDTIKREFEKSIPGSNCNLDFKTFSEYMKHCVLKNSLF